MELIFATNNKHKLDEVKNKLSGEFILKSLDDINCFDIIPEPFNTLHENAIAKAEFIWNKYKTNCFADDTGLEVDELNGEPGVFSARYAGPQNDAKANMKKLLENMKGKSNRSAKFKTVIALNLNGKNYIFEGIVEGKILTQPSGDLGFGYDPIFVPDGYSQSFAQMDLILKNTLSHRAKAVQKLTQFLSSL